MRLKPAAACALVAVWCGLGGAVAAHTGVRAVIEFNPSPPVAGEPCAVKVRFETKTGAPAQLAAPHVRLVAEMTGHAMPPLVVTLSPVVGAGLRAGVADRPGEFRGDVRFTMAGPWTITVRAEAEHDTIAGVFDLIVAAQPQRAAPIGAQTVDMSAPVSPSAVPAWPTLLVAIGLTVALEAGALARKYAAGRRQRHSARAATRLSHE